MSVIEIFERRKLACFPTRKTFLTVLQLCFIIVVIVSGTEKRVWMAEDNLQNLVLSFCHEFWGWNSEHSRCFPCDL